MLAAVLHLAANSIATLPCNQTTCIPDGRCGPSFCTDPTVCCSGKIHGSMGCSIGKSMQCGAEPTEQPADSPPAAGWSVSCASKLTASQALAGLDLSGRTVMTTGADGHIAMQLNLALASVNASLLLACYNVAKCAAAKQTILAASDLSEHQLDVVQLDLSSAASVRSAAQRVRSILSGRRGAGLHALVNAAGAYSTRLSHDGFVSAMEINLLGHALLTQLLLPVLTAGRVVNVAAAVYGTSLPSGANTTVAELTRLTTHVDPQLNASGGYFALSKLLFIHHATELAKRQPQLTAFAVNPGYAVEFAVGGWEVPQWMLRLPLPAWLKKRLPEPAQHIHDACKTNFAGLDACPQKYEQAAAVLAVAAATPNVHSYSGAYLDFETSALPPSAPLVFGPYSQRDPTCVPRTPPPLDGALSAAWYDQMLRLMNATTA
jgi:NAD(P)-dependent dehydrogenase (short-subunit alcohol dehydrogenase family)